MGGQVIISTGPIIDKMKNQKINYDKVLKKLIGRWEREIIRSKILLHSCCTSCGIYTLELLTQCADIAIYLTNSDIHSKNEYLQCAKVQEQFVEGFSRKTGANVKYIEAPYEPHKLMKAVEDKESADEKEGGLYCTTYFEIRLGIVAKAAVGHGYNHFGSTITLPPKGNAQLISELGMDVQKIYDVNYLLSDFKKSRGYERSIGMCNNYDIFRQCYCGCVFAAIQQGIDFETVNKEARVFLEQYLDQLLEIK